MASSSRPDLDEYFVTMLKLVASRSTCRRRQVGAILTDVKGHVLATGYNGVPSGITHCIDIECPGALDTPGDTSKCYAVHAEQNALLQCLDLARIHTLYCSCTPCFTCAKMLCNTPLQRIIVLEPYPDTLGVDVFLRKGIKVSIF